MKVLLVNNRHLISTVAKAEEISDRLMELGVDVMVDSHSEEITGEQFDAMIVLGGDGTMIRAARQYSVRDVPALGVNMGTVGFLSNITPGELDDCLDRFIAGDYEIEERMLLEVDVCQGQTLISRNFSLNEVSMKSKGSRAITIDVKIGGKENGVYRGDGIIVATPSGSTAYSLSCGGPITDPILDAFVMTPITSYYLNKRPLVIGGGQQIELQPLHGEEAVITIDGQIRINGQESCVVNVRRAQHKLRLVNMRPRHFFHTIMKRLRRSSEDFL